MKVGVFILVLFSVSAFIKAQDTLVYEGLVMTRTNIPYKSDISYKGVNIEHHIGLCDFFVVVSKSHNYEKAILNGVFFTSDTSIIIPECNTMRSFARDTLKKINETKLAKHNIFKEDYPPINLYNYETTIPIIHKKGARFWRDWNNNSSYLGRRYSKHYIFRYLIYKCRIKYIAIGNVEFETANRKAKNRADAFKKYNVPAYFITEIEFLKPIKN